MFFCSSTVLYLIFLIIVVLGLLGRFMATDRHGNPYYIHLVETIMIYAIVLFGLDIVVGYTGQVSLGHAGLFGIGAYTAGVLAARRCSSGGRGVGQVSGRHMVRR